MKKQRRALLKAAFVGGVAQASEPLFAMGTRPPPPGMRKIKGNVYINGQRAQIDQMVKEGDKVTTGPNSEAIYVVAANAFQMRENAEVQHLSDGVVTVLRVIKGGVLSVFGAGHKRIETPTATLGIRGTGCYIEAEPDSVYFCLCYGKADIVPVADESQRIQIETSNHDSPFYIGNAKAGSLIKPAPVKNHSNFELNMLEYESGRAPHFPIAGGGGGY